LFSYVQIREGVNKRYKKAQVQYSIIFPCSLPSIHYKYLFGK
jgi:hypothetical protein